MNDLDVRHEQKQYDRFEHYKLNVGPTDEFGELSETKATIKNIGWTLGNDCPYRCTHCYSMNARVKGKNMSIDMIDRVIDQLSKSKVATVNLGGNEPLFTNGINPKNTLLPYIITRLDESGIEVGLTTSGITLLDLYHNHRKEFSLLNDVDISFDSPFEDEHNRNRGARIFNQAIEALSICQQENIPHSCILCAMNWNFTIVHIDALVKLAKRYEANIRINPIKPIEPKHMAVTLTPEIYYMGFARLHELCCPMDLGEPPIAAVTNYQQAKRCPCGRTSFRIHSITPDGCIYVSPCVYLHDFKSNLDLLKNNLTDIINSPQFKVFRQRNFNPGLIDGCENCDLLQQCGGGCAARSYLYHLHTTGEKSLLSRDPYCPKRNTPVVSFPQNPNLNTAQHLVHMDYLCTWIGKPF